MVLPLLAPLVATVLIGASSFGLLSSPAASPRQTLRSAGLWQVASEPVAVTASACDQDAPKLAPRGLTRVMDVRPIGAKPSPGRQSKPQAPQAEELAEAVPSFRQALHICAVDRFDPRRALGLQKVVYSL